ncbi:hypothetical protein T02_6390 [Trichinella nativa]|uniref:Uncharacterized protein n=1 Tax=Trichinella nativa TaxID=6335 RepID=A0A0V1LS42_9BILA|nr:hypothetical protein T02_6390 [Trichinella nativa]
MRNAGCILYCRILQIMLSSGESSVANLKAPSFYMNTHAEESGHRSRKQTTMSSSQRSIDSGFVSSSFEDRSQSSWPSNSQNGNNLWNSWNSAETFSPNSLFSLFDNQQEAINSHSLQHNLSSPERFRNIYISQLSDSQNSNNGILHVPEQPTVEFSQRRGRRKSIRGKSKSQLYVRNIRQLIKEGILEAGVNILVYQDPQDNVHYASLLPNGRVQANVRLGPLFSSIQRWVGFCLGHQSTSRTPLFELLRVRYRNVSLFKINVILGVGLSRDEVVEQIELLRQKSLTKEITDYRNDFELNDPNHQLPVYMRSFINELLKAMPAVNNTKQNNCGRLRRSPRIRNRQQAARKNVVFGVVGLFSDKGNQSSSSPTTSSVVLSLFNSSQDFTNLFFCCSCSCCCCCCCLCKLFTFRPIGASRGLA